MTQPVHIHRIALGLTVTVPDEVLELNVGYLPWLLGDSLAGQVEAHVREARLGYFPAIDYFRDGRHGVDPGLIALIDEVAQFAVDYARRELRRRLARVFSSIHIDQAQCTAFLLPRARPSQPQALTDLGKHYAPSRVKLELVLISLDKLALANPQELAISKVRHWAREPFSGIDIGVARVVGGAS